ncbi:S-layer homology domain-containing protein [Paenibacillus filicis]|uniref:S-layer homology domain-containing protein n=1 Tax=Paenibacillus filicis TaxID=669464 RepID=A0ABU9DMA9_9BACL
MKRTYLTFCLTLVLLLSSWSTILAAGDPVFTLTMNEPEKPGGEISVTVKGEQADDIYAYEVNVEFDSKRLKFKGAKAEQGSGFSISPIVKGNKVQFAHTKVGKVAGDSGNVTLCTLTFEPIESGEAPISLKDVKLVNSKLVASTQSNSSVVLALVDKVPAGKEVSFTDIQGHWAKDVIVESVKRGFVDGYPDQTFRPDYDVSRSEFVAMLIRAMKIQPAAGNSLSFADADSIPDWAGPFIGEAVKLGIVSGYEDNSFRSSNPITRSELAVMIAKAFGMKVDEGAQSAFADADDIPDWAVPYVTAAADASLIQGRGENLFAPNDKATRAEAVNLILSVLRSKSPQGAE